MSEQENSLVVVEDGYVGRPIDRDKVVEFGDTLMGIHPQANEVGVLGMRTVAQLALITGANPMPGTNGIHVWKDKKGNTVIQFGIGFWRGEIEKEGGMLWIEQPRPMTDLERATYEVLDGQHGWICSGCRKRDALDLLREVKEIGIEMTLAEAKNEVGYTGTAIVNAQEYNKTTKSRGWTGDLRAERDLLRKLVPVMQRVRENVESGKFVDGGADWSVVSYAKKDRPELQAPEDYSAEDATFDLIDYDDPDTRPLKSPTVEMEELAAELDAEIEEVKEDSPTTEADVLPDDEQALWDSNSNPEFVDLLTDHGYTNQHHVHQALKHIDDYPNGLNDLPYITGRDSVEENIRAKRQKRLDAYRALKARKEV
ncbi:MAG: hypothetical protein GWN94_18680 [Phycisphaerae bacterium]|nr:hypothetical protein [Phycisphaerae bacterium]